MYWTLNPGQALFGKMLVGRNKYYFMMVTEVQYQGSVTGLVNFLVVQQWTTVKC